MNGDHLTDANLRVLVFAPIGRDTELTTELLTRSSIPCHPCRSLAEVCDEARAGAGAVLLTEEALSDPKIDDLAAVLQAQPPWSDISILLFAGGDRNQASLRALHKLEVLRNVTLLDRPLRTAAVVSTVRAALRGRQRQYELRDTLVALQKSRIDAEDANRLKDEFLATVSHELRTPLNAILGWVAMLRRARFEPSRVDSILEIVERNAKAQAQLIADVLDISRMISGRVKLEVSPVSLARIICDAVDSIRPGAAARGLELHLDVEEGPVANADPDRLQQIIWNLLSNACKFTPEGGRIDVSLRTDRTRATITVADTGAGISPDFLPFVFDRFRQAEQGFTRSHGGLGLGLAIVKHLTEMHGGEVAAKSDGPGKGATFEVRLPLARSIGRDDRARREDASTSSELPDVDLSDRSILVVDDDEPTRDLMVTLLTRSGAYVRAVDSVREAMAAFDADVPELVLADIGMPEEDGLSMIRRIRHLPPARGGLVRAIAVSAYARPEDRAAALSAGYDDFLTKPAMPGDVLRAVDRCLARPPIAMPERRRPRRAEPQPIYADRTPTPRQ
ncbi:MAG TPA: ATP-binding protein [Vicinamibacterales bacterium]|jgi:signal transduction histidine kinase/DNA-binding NarL/FixJ family response regulator